MLHPYQGNPSHPSRQTSGRDIITHSPNQNINATTSAQNILGTDYCIILVTSIASMASHPSCRLENTFQRDQSIPNKFGMGWSCHKNIHEGPKVRSPAPWPVHITQGPTCPGRSRPRNGRNCRERWTIGSRRYREEEPSERVSQIRSAITCVGVNSFQQRYPRFIFMVSTND